MLKRRLLLLLAVGLVLPSVGVSTLACAGDSQSVWSNDFAGPAEDHRRESGDETPAAGGEAETQTETEDQRLLAKKQCHRGCRRAHPLREDYDAHLPAGVASMPDRPPKA